MEQLPQDSARTQVSTTLTCALFSFVVLRMYGSALFRTILYVMAKSTLSGEDILCFKVCIAGAGT